MRFWFPVWFLLVSVLFGFSGVGSFSGTDIHEPLPLPENKGCSVHARFYDANLGRFHILDEYEGRTGEPLSLHKYLSAHGNPVTGWDPSGRFSMMDMMHSLQSIGMLSRIAIPVVRVYIARVHFNLFYAAVNVALRSGVVGSGVAAGSASIGTNLPGGAVNASRWFNMLARFARLTPTAFNSGNGQFFKFDALGKPITVNFIQSGSTSMMPSIKILGLRGKDIILRFPNASQNPDAFYY